MCFECHQKVTDNKAQIKALQFARRYVWVEDKISEELDPHPPALTEGESDAGHHASSEMASGGAVQVPPSVSPGETCPVCERRVPHPKKKTSPKSKPFAFRIPLDATDQFKEIVDAAAEHLGCKEEPNHVYKTLLSALVLLLQEDKPEGRVA